MSQLSGVLRVSNGNVTGIADRLSDEGFVERIAVPGDRRATKLRLTQTGLEEFNRQAQSHEEWVDRMLTGVSPDDARAMAARLQAFAAAAEIETVKKEAEDAQ
jgi:DNA-binding MarR family transcriptional regulator